MIVGAIDSVLFAKSFLLCLEGLVSVAAKRRRERNAMSADVVGLINAGREKEMEEESPIEATYNVERGESDCRRCSFLFLNIIQMKEFNCLILTDHSRYC